MSGKLEIDFEQCSNESGQSGFLLVRELVPTLPEDRVALLDLCAIVNRLIVIRTGYGVDVRIADLARYGIVHVAAVYPCTSATPLEGGSALRGTAFSCAYVRLRRRHGIDPPGFTKN